MFYVETLKMVYSYYKKLRIIFFRLKGLKAPEIEKRLLQEGLVATRQGIQDIIKRYEATRSIGRQPGSGRKSKVTDEIKRIVDDQMKADDETSAFQLHQLLMSKGHYLSIRTILQCRQRLGWTFRGSAYCQLIRQSNKVKRLEWARANLNEANNGFQNVIWTDETTVQLETHRRFCCHKRGEPPKNKPRYVFFALIIAVPRI